jgi:hypothetical protein
MAKSAGRFVFSGAEYMLASFSHEGRWWLAAHSRLQLRVETVRNPNLGLGHNDQFQTSNRKKEKMKGSKGDSLDSGYLP